MIGPVVIRKLVRAIGKNVADIVDTSQHRHIRQINILRFPLLTDRENDFAAWIWADVEIADRQVNGRR